jgi:hypothetical protein
MDTSAVIVLLVFVVAMVIARRLARRISLRPLPAREALLQQVSRAVESGGALHVSMGTGGVGSTDTMSSLASAYVLDRLADQAAAASVSPLVTISDPTLLPVAQDSLRRAHTGHGHRENYDPGQVLMLSPQPMAYGAAAMGVAQDSATAGNVLVGSFGPEVVLLTESATRKGVPQVVGAAEPQTQALIYPMADYLLLGEEIFAASAYLDGAGGPSRLLAQDMMRALVVAVILVMAVLSLLGFALT